MCACVHVVYWYACACQAEVAHLSILELVVAALGIARHLEALDGTVTMSTMHD